jgi:hypothetical protein
MLQGLLRIGIVLTVVSALAAAVASTTRHTATPQTLRAGDGTLLTAPTVPMVPTVPTVPPLPSTTTTTTTASITGPPITSPTVATTTTTAVPATATRRRSELPVFAADADDLKTTLEEEFDSGASGHAGANRRGGITWRSP